MTSSTDIEAYLKNSNHFRGCFAVNNLPSMPSTFPSSLIVNTDPLSKPGDHWVGLVLTKRKCYYFDSFGLGVMDMDIIKFLKQAYKKVTINNECIQHITSDKCGLYCIAFVNKVTSKMSYKNFISKFDLVQLINNDKIVVSLM